MNVIPFCLLFIFIVIAQRQLHYIFYKNQNIAISSHLNHKSWREGSIFQKTKTALGCKYNIIISLKHSSAANEPRSLFLRTILNEPNTCWLQPYRELSAFSRWGPRVESRLLSSAKRLIWRSLALLDSCLSALKCIRYLRTVWSIIDYIIYRNLSTLVLGPAKNGVVVSALCSECSWPGRPPTARSV